MKDVMPLVITLTVITAAAALALALVFAATEQPIAEADLNKKVESLAAVLPEFANKPVEDSTVSGDYTFYAAKDASGAVIALAFEAKSSEGYGGTIELLAGITPDGQIIHVKVVKQLETPGLGSKSTDPKWIGQFDNAGLANRTLEVRKDNQGTAEKPPIDAITGATITSRAVTKAVRLGLEYYQAHRDEILSAIANIPAPSTGGAQ